MRLTVNTVEAMRPGADPRSTNDHRCGALALTRQFPEWGRDAPGASGQLCHKPDVRPKSA